MSITRAGSLNVVKRSSRRCHRGGWPTKARRTELWRRASGDLGRRRGVTQAPGRRGGPEGARGRRRHRELRGRGPLRRRPPRGRADAHRRAAPGRQGEIGQAFGKFGENFGGGAEPVAQLVGAGRGGRRRHADVSHVCGRQRAVMSSPRTAARAPPTRRSGRWN